MDRASFLGGSDAAAVLGVSPYTTPLELWQEKTGRKARDFSDPKRRATLERGKKLEPFIREMVVAKLADLGCDVEVVGVNRRFDDNELEFLSCEIDFELRITGVMAIGGAEVAFVDHVINADAKSVTGFARKKWGDVDTEDVPIEYAAQFMHGLGITGRDYCLVAALRSFDDVDIYWCVRDDETIAAMRARMLAFWRDHVLADIAPDPLTFDDVKALFPLDNGLAIEATDEVEKIAQDYLAVRSKRIQFEKDEDELKLALTKYIAPHTRLTYRGADLLTWKGQNDTRLDQSALAAAELFKRDVASGEFVRIANPIAEFSRTKVIRVLRAAPAKRPRG